MRDARRGLPYIFGKNDVASGVSRRFTRILLPRTAPDDIISYVVFFESILAKAPVEPDGMAG